MTNQIEMQNLTIEEIELAINQGLAWCVECEEFIDACIEPDARGYTCPECGQPALYGAEEALLMGYLT